MTQIDSGLELYLDGELCREPHPKVAEYFRHNIADARAELADLDISGRMAANLRDDIDRWRWYLERNGFDPDEPPKGTRPLLGYRPETEAANRSGD